MSYCSNCGNKLSDKDLFCSACGQKITQNQPQNTVNLPEDKLNHFQENKPAYNYNYAPQKRFAVQNVPQPKKNIGCYIAIFIVTFITFTAMGLYLLFSEQISTKISNILNPSVTVSFEASIPEGVTVQEKTVNMNLIADITRHRLSYLGYSNATVSVAGNIITVKHIPKQADINSITDYLTASSSTAEFIDSDGNIVMTNAEFASATAKAGSESGIKCQISIYFTDESLKTFSYWIKKVAVLQNDKNYIVLVVNGVKIVNLLISSDRAQTGWETNGISFNVTDNGYKFNLTAEELERALNSGGELPYALTGTGTAGTVSTSVIETSGQDTPKIDLQKLLDEGKTLREIFDSADGTNHYDYVIINGTKCELWVKGDKKKLIQTYSTNEMTGTFYCYGDTLYSYTNGIAIEMPSMIYNYSYDAWEYTRRFFDENENVEFVNIGSEYVNGEKCTVFNLTYKNIYNDITYRTGRIYVSNNYGCIVRHVRIIGDLENETLKLIGQSIEVTESTVIEYYGLKAYMLVDSDVNMPAGTQIVKNPMG